MPDHLYIGVDVGTGSVRAGVFSPEGQLLSSCTKEIQINNPEPDYYEQSSGDIWNAVVFTVKEATKSVEKSRIQGLSFCATCSLVALDNLGNPVSLSKEGDPKWDIVMWMDHRAEEEAEFINKTGHKVLNYVGGRISLEMQTPKLLWLKKNMEESFQKTQNFFDLPDFLRWKVTGESKRSMCSVVCKWTHLNSPEGNKWDTSYFKEIGLEDAIPKIGSTFSFPSDKDRLTTKAANELGLTTEVYVGYSMIDAHAGVLGMMGCKVPDSKVVVDCTQRLALICGTSNCHMALSKKECKVGGVWGPYFEVILPNLYLNEGGQSAAGKLVDYVVTNHAAYQGLVKEYKSHGNVLSELEKMLVKRGKEENVNISGLTKHFHVWPDFHGNRSPLADPSLRGMINGLTLDDSRDHLALVYLATMQALAYGSRMIKESLEAAGHNFQELVICGGLTKSGLFLQTHADILGLPVIVPECPEPVLLGTAISAAATGGKLEEVISSMAGSGTRILPNVENRSFHDRKYQVFQEMVKDQKKYREIMN